MTLTFRLAPAGLGRIAHRRPTSRIPEGVTVLLPAGCSAATRRAASDELQAQGAKMGRCREDEVAWFWAGAPRVRDARCPGCDGPLSASNWCYLGPWLDGSDRMIGPESVSGEQEFRRRRVSN